MFKITFNKVSHKKQKHGNKQKQSIPNLPSLHSKRENGHAYNSL